MDGKIFKLRTALSFVMAFTTVVGGNFGFSKAARANAELDRRYALDTVGYLRAWDNADGLFSGYVSDAYQSYFNRQSRFSVQDLGKADAVLSGSKIPYKKLIEDNEVLAQVARAAKSQTLIRTEVRKEGANYRFQIDWLLAPSMEVLGRDTLELNDPRDGTGFSAGDLRAQIGKTLEQVIHKVPFSGSITGKDGNTVTLNMGKDAGIEAGDTLQIGTIEEVKRHPLTHEIVEWRIVNTGRLTIDQVDEKISFAHIDSEDPDQKIARSQKVVAILKKTVPSPMTQSEAAPPSENPATREFTPSYGFIEAGLQLGSFGRDYSSIDNTIGESGGGFMLGAAARGELWFTRNWFADLALGYSGWSYSQHGTVAGSSTASNTIGGSGLTQFTLDGGYAFYLTDDLMGPKGWVKLGYRSNAYSLPDSSSAYTASVDFKSLFIGLGGEIPIRDRWGAALDFGFGVFKGASEDSNLSGAPTSVTDASFQLGTFYRYTPRITFRATLDFQWNNADFDTDRSLSQKAITFAPALVYYF